MQRYQNRHEAGKVLARELSAFANRNDTLVLALPRGGVPVAFEIANALNLPLDVYIVRKIGVPGHSELAMGAIAMGNVRVFNQNILSDLHIEDFEIQAVIKKEEAELQRREKAYRGNVPFPSLKNMTIILVDDGIATGATMRAAIQSLKQLHPKDIVVAVPVADKLLCHELLSLADKIVCPLQPTSLHAVGAWYDDFSQTEDAEVHDLLNKAKKIAQRQ